MAELTLKTRLLNKMSGGHVADLLKGEINFYPAGDYLVMEVGGADEKPFAALASDVYAWAKAENKPSYTAEEIDGLAGYIAGKVQDTNTTYTFTIKEETGELEIISHEINGASTTVGTFDVVSHDELEARLADCVEALKNYVLIDDFNAFKETVNAEAIADAKKAGTDAAAALEAYKTANDTALAKVKDTADKAAVATDVASEIARVEDLVSAEASRADAAEKKALADAKAYADGLISGADLDQYTTEAEVKSIVDNVIASAADSDTYNSLTKLVDYIDAHGGEAADMAEAIETLEGKVDVEKVSTAIAAAEARAATDAQSKADAAEANAKAYADSLEHKDTTYTAGAGLKLDGTVFSIDTDLVFILDANA